MTTARAVSTLPEQVLVQAATPAGDAALAVDKAVAADQAAVNTAADNATMDKAARQQMQQQQMQQN